MKKILLTFYILAFVPLFVTTANAEEINTECKGLFLDMELESTLCAHAEYLYHQEVLSGSEGKFHASNSLTRGQAAKIIKNAFDIPSNTSGERFDDVGEENTFFESIQSLKNANIVSGFNEEFGSELLVTRGSLVKMVVNSIKFSEPNIFIEDEVKIIDDVFTDVKESVFKSFIQEIYFATDELDRDFRIIGGYNDNTFRPNLPVSRLGTAKIVANAIKFADTENVTCEEYFCQDRFWKEELFLFDWHSPGTEVFIDFNLEIGMPANWEVERIDRGRYFGGSCHEYLIHPKNNPNVLLSVTRHCDAYPGVSTIYNDLTEYTVIDVREGETDILLDEYVLRITDPTTHGLQYISVIADANGILPPTYGGIVTIKHKPYRPHAVIATKALLSIDAEASGINEEVILNITDQVIRNVQIKDIN